MLGWVLGQVYYQVLRPQFSSHPTSSASRLGALWGVELCPPLHLYGCASQEVEAGEQDTASSP